MTLAELIAERDRLWLARPFNAVAFHDIAMKVAEATPPRAALSRAIQRAIDGGSPIVEEKPE